jgi:hypothetical protein
MNWNDATAGTDLNGNSVISRHGDYSPVSQAVLDNFIILIHIPSEPDLQPWLHIGAAGEMAATASLNSSGFFIGKNDIDDQNWNPNTVVGYEPVIFTIRRAMESLDYNQDGENNIKDIMDVISSNQNGYSNGYTFSVLGPSTAVYDSMIAVIAEVAPEEPFITYRNNNFQDAIPGDNLYAANSQIARNNSLNFCSRYTNMVSNIGWGTSISSQANWDMMKEFSNLGNLNVYFVQFVPEWNQLKLSVTRDNILGFLNDPVTFDVGEFFQLPIPEASFSADTTLILAGESIQFTDLSSNDPTAWKWEFAGGTPESDTVQNPVVQYNSPGVFDAILIASNKYGSDTLKLPDYITVGAVSIDEVETIPIQIYPNPCTDFTQILVPFTISPITSIDIYGAGGRLTKRIVEKEMIPHEQEIKINVSDLPAGIYYIRMQAGNIVGSGKMLLMK